MDRNAVIECIEELKVLEDLSPALRKEVAGILERVSALRSVPAGGLWIREHDKAAPNKGFVLLRGAVLVQKSGSPDIEIQAPELLGETMQYTQTHERTATVTATSDSVLLRFMWDDFWREIDQSLAPPDCDKVRNAVSELAWRHLAQ